MFNIKLISNNFFEYDFFQKFIIVIISPTRDATPEKI